MRLAVVFNPRSGTAPSRDLLERLLGADGAQVGATAIDDLTPDHGGGLSPADLAAASRTLGANGAPDRIVVAGGDGSIGLTALIAAEMRVPLAILPVGTANDFARALALPLELERACLLARDPAAAPRHAELALAGTRPFVNAAATGLSVAAAQAAVPYKARLGALAYTVGALKAGATAMPLECRVRCDGRESYAGLSWQIIVATTGAFGGGSRTGGTSPDDGQLDVVIVPAGPRLGLIRRAWGMRRGHLHAQSGITSRRGREIEVTIDPGPATFNIDGDLRRCEPARFTQRPGGFEVVTSTTG